ncbi:MAG: penicillin-binding transpeptidase domain-containing protein [Bacillota bacterium]|nr:penicillin-binding transpeptidase domain-containing protein [Bacillota bacterium]
MFFFFAAGILCVALSLKLGWVQIVMGEEYSKAAVEQQTRDVPVSAQRGVIYDTNGVELAISATTHTIWARPSEIKSAKKDEENQARLIMTAQELSEILSLDYDETLATISQEKSLVKVARYVDKETAQALREAELEGISIVEDVKRYYPLGAFASHVLGTTTDDNQGLTGLELKYDQYLSGVSGRWIKSADIDGDKLAYGVEKYYQAEDGLSIVLTLDSVIQHYVEKAIAQVAEDTSAKRVLCIVMDPKTGDILAMAMTPEYDPNSPRIPLGEEEQSYFETLDSAAQQDYWNEMWRNAMISDTYEPGSTFKLLTTAIALEEGITTPTETFTCQGAYQVAGVTLRCWRYPNVHGTETLTQAVQNSCNPVFNTLAQRMGKETMYEYLEAFGLQEKTGVDYPGEGGNNLQNIDSVGPVELATISYGQGIAVTPISLLRAICALGNDGMLMQPRLVKELRDSDGNVVESYEPVEVRQVVSKETADEMCLIMESVVSEGGGGTARVMGYRVGGKTGTANKVEDGAYGDGVYASFLGMAPMDDPQVAVLVVVDEPQGVKYGSQTAAPGAKLILEDTLRYLNIEPSYTEEELEALNSDKVAVPSVAGENFSEAIGILGGVSLQYVVSPALDLDSVEDFTVVDQYPPAGETVSKNSTVYLYRE